jgi:hypothetical protein
MLADRSHRRFANCLIDHIGDLGLTIVLYRIGQDAEGGWELAAIMPVAKHGESKQSASSMQRRSSQWLSLRSSGCNQPATSRNC